MTTIDRLRAGNSSTPATSSSIGIQENSLLNSFAFLSDFEELLRKIMEEAATQQSTTNGLNTQSDVHEAGAETTPGASEETSGQPYYMNSTMSLTQALKDMLMTNANSQTLFADLQSTASEGNSMMMQEQVKQLTAALTQLQAQLQAQQDAEAHRSFWQKFTDGFKTAINFVWDVKKKEINFIAGLVDKALSGMAGKDVHAAEKAAHVLETGVEKSVEGLETVVQFVQDQIHYGIEDLSKGLAWVIATTVKGISGKDIDADKLNFACEIAIAVAILVLTTVATMGTGTAEAAGAEGAGLAAEAGAEGAGVAGEAGGEIEMADLGGGIRDIDGGADGLGGLGDATAASNGASQASSGARLMNFLRENSWSVRIFATTSYLQNSDFAQDLAKQCTDDPAKQAIIAQSINAGLSMASAIAGYSMASSAFNGNKLNSAINDMQLLEQIVAVPGQVGTMKWDFKLANMMDDMGALQARVDLTEGMEQNSEAAMSQGDEWFSSFMRSVNDNISAIANMIPMASKAESDALNEAHSA